ncbi:MAG: ATP-binding protein [Oscillochloris sp.]|nr:ATP-binding protein [Oscillochloris sp.]
MLPRIDFPQRTDHIFGRQELLDVLSPTLARPVDDPLLIFLIGDGGTGKTRLIEEIAAILIQRKQVYLPLYDFYHIDRFRASAIEETIVAAIVRQRPAAAQAFAAYDRKRDDLAKARQRGTAFLQAQEAVRNAFVACYNQAAAQAPSTPIVLLFDSIEQAVNLQDPAEERLNASARDASSGGELWLSSILPRLKHTVVLLSGRPQSLYGQPVDFYQRLQADTRSEIHTIGGLSLPAAAQFVAALQQQLSQPLQPDEIHEFAQSVPLDAATLSLWHVISAGLPFWLSALFTCAMFGSIPPQIDAVQSRMDGDTPPDLAPAEQAELRAALMNHFLGTINTNTHVLVLALQWMATMRKGASADILRHIAAHEQIAIGDPGALVAQLARLLVVKQRVVPRYTYAGGEAQETLLFLHDELYHWLDQNLPGAVSLRGRVSAALIGWYDQAIAAAEAERLSAVDQLLTLGDDHPEALALRAQRDEAQRRREMLVLDRLGYCYQRDEAEGVREYNLRSYIAILNRSSGYGVMLRQEALRNHYRLHGAVPFSVEVECAARWLLRTAYNEDLRALEMLGQIKAYYELEAQFPGSHYALLHLAEADVLLRMRPDERERIRAALDIARSIIEADRDTPPADVWTTIIKLQIAYWYGFYYRLSYDLFDAIEEYRYALRIARYYAQDVTSFLGPILQNLAFAYSEQGNVEEGRRYGLRALYLNQRYGSDYNVAPSLNTLARVEIRAGQPLKALQFARQARAIFERFDSARGLSLCLPVHAEAYRKIGEQLGDTISLQEQAFADAIATFEEARALLQREGVTSAERWREVLQGIGCSYRSWGLSLRNRNEASDRAGSYFQQARSWLEQALEVAQRAQSDLIRIDIYEDLASLYVNEDAYDQRVYYCLDQIEQLSPPIYRIEPGRGLRGTSRPIYGFWRELGQSHLQRMLCGFGKYDVGWYHYHENGRSSLLHRADPADLHEAGCHLLLMLAYLLQYAPTSVMLDRALHLALRELRLRSEHDLKLIAQEIYRTAREYRLMDSQAQRLAERLIDQAHADLGIGF